MPDPSIVAQWRQTISYKRRSSTRGADGSPASFGSTQTAACKIDNATSLIANGNGGIDRVASTTIYTSAEMSKGDMVWLPSETVDVSKGHSVNGVEVLVDEYGNVDHYEISIS